MEINLNASTTVAWIGVAMAVITTVATVAVSYGLTKGKIDGLGKLMDHHFLFDHREQDSPEGGD